MSSRNHDREFEIDQDLAFQRKEWRVERVGWLVMLGLVLATLLGAFGRGVLSGAEGEVEGGALRVNYERITRHESPSHLYVRLAPSLLDGEHVSLWIDRKYVEAVEMTRIIPQPERVVLGQNRVTYAFEVEDASRPLDITFSLTAEKFLGRRLRIGVEDRAVVHFTQFVLP
ncbi:MAG: hypothetical protein ABR543_06035 [Gemmatimonadaceae bacterium]